MSSHRIALITDSTCDIPSDLIAGYGITVVPLHVIWGEETFQDRVDLQPADFYNRLGKDPRYPTTSHTTPDGFLEVYARAAKEGAETIVVITLSSDLSGACEAAKQAATMSETPVQVYDSRSVTMGLGWQVIAAARARRDGGDARAMIEAADAARRRVAVFVSLDTLEYLHKGGRIGGATRFIGSLLDLKPLVYVDRDSGRVEPAGRVRTRRRALSSLYERFFDELASDGTMHIAVMHGDAPEDAERVADQIREAYDPAELLVGITGPVLGVHTGPGAIALCGYAD